MKKWWLVPLLICSSFLSTGDLLAQEAAPGGPTGRLFVHTSPMGARVLVDGALQDRVTPLVLELPPGRYRLELSREGYDPLTLRVEVKAGKSTAVRQALAGNRVAAAFPREAEIVLDGEAVPAGQTVFGLGPGTYRLQSRGETLSVKRQAPQDRWIDALHIVFPLFLGFAVYLTVDEVLNPSGGDSPFSPAVIATYGVTTALIGADIALNIAKRRFERSLTFDTLPSQAPTVSPQALYREVEALFAAGRLDEALAESERLLDQAPESPYLPYALYRRAQILGLQGLPDAAVSALEALLQEYPVPDLYDRCLLGLAELHLQAGRYAKAADSLGLLAYVDPEVDRADALSLATEVLRRWTEADPEAAEAAAADLKALAPGE